MDKVNYNKIYRKLIQKFIVASLFLLLVFFLKQLIINDQIAKEKNTSYIINIAGRQRMLSQKIVKDVIFIQEDYLALDDATYIKDLEQSLELWKISHDELLEFNKSKKILNKKDNKIDKLFEEIEADFLSMVYGAEDFLHAIENGEQDTKQLETYVTQVVHNEASFLEKMDSIVFQYESKGEESIQYIKTTHMLLFLLVVGILIFITVAIFIPLLNYLKNAFLKANESNRNLLKMFETMKGALFVIKRDGEILFMNGDAQKIVSKEKEANEIRYLAKSVNWREFDIGDLIETVKDDDSRIEDIETTIEDNDGNLISVILSAVSGKYNGDEAIMLNLFDVTVQKKAEQALKNIATKDELTGLYNRHFLENILEEEFTKAERYETPLSAALLDLDFFKKVNDKWGHPVGDSVLKLTADIVKENIRKSDYPIRIGGEEFLILMPNTDAEGAVAMAEKVRKAFEQTQHPVTGRFTVSIGVAERISNEKYLDLYSRVDGALYQAKENGRNCVRLASSI